MEPSIEIRDMDASDEYFVGTCTHLDESEEIDACARKRLAWLQAVHEKGSRVKVATLDGKRAGFLHVMPIEICPWGPLGRDLLVIPCLVSVNKGYGEGKALLTGAEEEAVKQGCKGIATVGYHHNHWFMPADFFEANGFLRCQSISEADFEVEHKATILWKLFDEHADPPVFLKPNYEFKPIRGKVVIDLFWNGFCQTSIIEAQRVIEVAAEFEDLVALNEYSADDRQVLFRHQIARGIFINGREIYRGHEAPKYDIRAAIARDLCR